MNTSDLASLSGRIWEVLSLGDSALIAGAIYSELSRCGMAPQGAWSREQGAEQPALSRCEIERKTDIQTQRADRQTDTVRDSEREIQQRKRIRNRG